MSRLFLTLCLCWFSLFSIALQADTADDLTAARTKLEGLNPDDAESQPIRERYQQLVSALENTLRYEKRAAKYRELIDQQPREIEVLKKALEKPAVVKPLKGLDKRTLSGLNQLKTRAKAELLELESAQSSARKTVRQNDNKLVSLRERLGQLRQQSDSSQDRSKKDKEGRDELRAQLKNARSSELAAEAQALELELLVLPGQTELANLQLEQLQRDIDQQRAELEQIEASIQERRRVEAERELSKLEQPAVEEAVHPLLIRTQQKNKMISDRVREVITESEQIGETRTELSKQLKKLDRSHRTIEQQLALDIGYMGGEMRRLMLRMTQPIDTRKTLTRINKLRLQNLEQEQQALEPMPEPTAPVDGEELTEAQQKRYEKLLADRKGLNSRLRKSRQQLISSLSELLTVQEAYNEQIRQSRELLNQNLLWHPTVPTIELGWVLEIQHSIVQLYKHWHQVREQRLFTFGPALAGSLIAVMISLLIALSLRSYKRDHEQQWYQQLGNVMQDRIGHTLKLLIMGPLIAAPLPLLLLALSFNALDLQHPDAESVASALKITAISLWGTHSLYLWLKLPWGLFPAHLSVPEPLTKILSRRVVSIFLLATPILVLMTVMDGIGDDTMRSGLGRLLLIILMGLITLFWVSLWRPTAQMEHFKLEPRWWRRAHLWLGALILFQLGMIGLCLWGYTLTAGALTLVQLIAIDICLATFIFYRIGVRWLLVEERKLAFVRAKARRAEILAAREKNEEEPVVEENLLDLQTVSDQAKVLLKTATVILLVSLFWWLLGDFLPTLGVLDNIELWSSSISGADGDILQPITLKDLLTGILVLSLSLLAAYNLPGLLELLVLRHLPLGQGSGYAITTMIKYLLILIGITSGFNQLGFAWEKLQWLVAALGVGLGFGLQEIVANFVSGIIILFERPVRIGDTVTVGNLTGTVSRIQMRATTITDWDRKEVIIPNKTFITDQLINWSLSDAITRVVIPVGLAYGSDTVLARSLLLEVAQKNTRIMHDPEPQAFFLGFGDSTLNFELRIYVEAMADRLEVTHELNSEIDAAFKQHDIEIAFPQLQVHMTRTKN